MNIDTGKWIRGVPMTDLGALVTQVILLFGSLVLTVAAYHLLLTDARDYMKAMLEKNMDPNLMLSMANAYISSRQSTGLALTGILAGLWTGKFITNAVSHHGNRKTSKEYMQEKSKQPPKTDNVQNIEHANRVTQEHNIV